MIEGWEGVTAIPVGAFADTDFPAPKFFVYENRKHAWVIIDGRDVDHSATPSTDRNPGAQYRGSAEERG
ncbi:MAG: hypothetical protein AAF950_15975 [Pseudomonadota bacterium]